MSNSVHEVFIDLDDILFALKRDKLSLLTGEQSIAVPTWVEWLIWFGQWMRVQAILEGRRIAVIRMPNRRLAAAFTAIGSVFASAKLHDDALDWVVLMGLAPGTKVFWREFTKGKFARRSGTVIGVRQIEGSDFLEVLSEGQKRTHQSNRLFAKSAALSYGITLGLVTAVADERLGSGERLLQAALTDAPKGWLSSPSIECVIVTERTTFFSDIDGLAINVAGIAKANCADILAIADSGGRSHGKTMVASARNYGVLDEFGLISILDGPVAALRLNDTTASSVVVLLDEAEYDEEIEQLFKSYIGYSVDSGVHLPKSGVMVPPSSVECFIFGLPKAKQNL